MKQQSIRGPRYSQASALVSVLVMVLGSCSRLEAPPPPAREESPSNTRPKAVAGHGGVYTVGHELTLDGTSSFDFDGEVVSYEWLVLSAPAGAANFEGSSNALYSYYLEAIGDYVFELTVTDNEGVSDTEIVAVQSVLHQPIGVQIEGIKRVKQGQPMHLEAVLDTGDATDVNVSWEIVSAPNGANASVEGATTSTPTLHLDRIGLYGVELHIETPWTSYIEATNVFVTADQLTMSAQIFEARHSPIANRIVYRSQFALYVVDTVIGTEHPFPFLFPSGFDISPDGSQVAVMHRSAPSSVADTLSIADLATPDQIQAFPGASGEPLFESSERVLLTLNFSVRSLDTASGTIADELVQTSLGRQRLANTQPATLYAFKTFGEFGIDTYDISASPFQFLGNSSTADTIDTCGEIWPSEDGEFVITACGDVLRTSNAPLEHLAIQTTLPITDIRQVSFGPNSGRFVVAHGATYPLEIELFDSSSFASLGTISVPEVLHPDSEDEYSPLVVGGAFFSPDETELLVYGNLLGPFPLDPLGAIVRVAID